MQEFFIHKVKGEFRNVKKWKQFWATCEDGTYKLVIERADKRTLPQNAYYWSTVVALVYEGLRDAGFEAVRSKEDAHEIMKSLFLKVIEEKNGIKIEKVRSTSRLSKKDFSEYLDAIFLWASDYLSVTIPEPNEQTQIDYESIGKNTRS